MTTAFQRNAFQNNAFQIDSLSAPRVEVMWPRTSLRGGKRKESDLGLLRELIRNRNEAIAEYQRRNETTEEPEVRIEIPLGVSPEAQRALRDFLALYKIKAVGPRIGLVTELTIIEAQRLEDELRLLEEEELAIVLMLAV